MEAQASVNSGGAVQRLSSSTQHCAAHRSIAFNKEDAATNLPFDVDSSTHLEIVSSEQPLFSYMLTHLSKQITKAKSIRADMGNQCPSTGRICLEDDDFMDFLCKGKGKGSAKRQKTDNEIKTPDPSLGIGWHRFEYKHTDSSVDLHVLMQRIGDPAGNSPAIFESMVLFVQGTDSLPLLRICQQAVEAATMQKENRVSLFRYDLKIKYWSLNARRMARTLDSVVLDENVKRPLMADVEWFVKDETRAFYAKHGIPYHRCFLFHGPPGAGKTSFIYALAGHLQRNLCFMQMDRSLTDDSFRTAMSKLPAPAMVVLEDVDAIFSTHREADHGVSSLSFSGFLNSLDGLGAPDDVVICLTTNHPDKLDPAIMRPGRIDLKVEFKTPSRDVATKYFLTFYPGEDAAAAAFGASVGSRIAEKKVSMAQLQHFFLACHRLELSPDKVAEHIKEFNFDSSTSSVRRGGSAYC
eukprot:TRINITY_DN19363_c0_g2_i1.p1 TRINITY_DN19363_c0_g2~~TRINITY_DN19363_c0_g2_i1.p1  ORF type:complete len:466 (-),score=62.03 TRINITY_DN19363_c0_g2_i1:228-1625(-)